MSKRICLFAAMIAGVLCSPALAQQGGDPGGRISDMMGNIRQANRHAHSGFVIDYQCNSTCTMKLGAAHVCITTRAAFGFHAAHVRPDPRSAVDPDSTRTMASYYPPGILAWVIRNNALATTDFIYMDANTAHSLGIPWCPRNVGNW